MTQYYDLLQKGRKPMHTLHTAESIKYTPLHQENCTQVATYMLIESVYPILPDSISHSKRQWTLPPEWNWKHPNLGSLMRRTFVFLDQHWDVRKILHIFWILVLKDIWRLKAFILTTKSNSCFFPTQRKTLHTVLLRFTCGWIRLLITDNSTAYIG